MKIAVSSDGDSLESMIDQRFGRCKYFIIVDTENKEETKIVENQGAVQGHGAGIRAAQQLGEQNVKAVLTGQLGPNATNVLNQLGIQAYHASGTVNDAIEKFTDQKLEEINEVSAPHSGTIQKEKTGDRIFFPLLDNNGENSKISPHFGNAPFFGLYDVESKELEIIENNLDHTDPTQSPIDQIQEAVNPTTIFAQAIGGRAINIIKQKGLSLKTGPFDTVKDAVENLDELKDQTQSCGQGQH